VASHCREAGVLVLQADNIVRINPPLTASDTEIRLIVEALTGAVTATAPR
jgi:4-aminobutyrate aminotransferase-like enzyme